MTLIEQIRAKAKAANKRIVLAEGTEERHSAKYIGTTTLIKPPDIPCRIRPNAKSAKLPPGKKPLVQQIGIEIENKNAEAIIIFFRPNHSASWPAKSEDTTVPHKTIPTINPICSVV